MKPDAIVVGSGPNGLAAAITLVRAGVPTLLVERSETPGGGMRSSELTLPGFIHDECSAVHPLGVCSPFFRSLPLQEHGLRWLHSDSALAHVMNDGTATVLDRSLESTVAGLGEDGQAYRDLLEPFIEHAEPLLHMLLGPLRVPRSPFLFARFGMKALRSLRGITKRFRGERAPALLAGIGAHAMVPPESLTSASFALVLLVAGHAAGWPIAKGGSGSIAKALLSYYRSLGGEIVLGQDVKSLDQLPPAKAYLLDTSARALASIAGDRLSARYRRRLSRFVYGPGVYKVDWALREPIPWRDAGCRRSITVHLSGTLDDVSRAMHEIHHGRVSPQPLILLGQPSIVDGTRSPANTHTAWAYCHVPHGSDFDALELIESQIEKHAPGFRDVVLARHARDARALEAHNPNYVGGDINSGLSSPMQLFFRPVMRFDPYATPAPEVFLCSSSTPPGGAVHGMNGYFAASSALRKRFGLRAHDLARGPIVPARVVPHDESPAPLTATNAASPATP